MCTGALITLLVFRFAIFCNSQLYVWNTESSQGRCYPIVAHLFPLGRHLVWRITPTEVTRAFYVSVCTSSTVGVQAAACACRQLACPLTSAPSFCGNHAAPQPLEAGLRAGQWQTEAKALSSGEREGEKQESQSEAGRILS